MTQSEAYKAGWEQGVQWAKDSWYDSPEGKNVDGGMLGRVLGKLNGYQSAGFAEGVRWALGNPQKAINHASA